MANSRQSETIFSPSSKRPTKRTRSSITEHSFQGIASSPREGSVTYVSGTNCHPCVGSLNLPFHWFTPPWLIWPLLRFVGQCGPTESPSRLDQAIPAERCV